MLGDGTKNRRRTLVIPAQAGIQIGQSARHISGGVGYVNLKPLKPFLVHVNLLNHLR